MGLILCKTQEGKIPYVIKNVGQEVYSLEEMSYYIFNNVYLLGQDLINEELIAYIASELKEERLATNLTTLLQKKAPLSEQIVFFLRYVDYYSDAEIMELKKIIDDMNSKHIHERLCARADALLANNCCHSAIRNYELVIEEPDKELSDKFYAKAYHNIGVCYARLFQYERAYVYFERAYELGGSDESRRQAGIASLMNEQLGGKSLCELNEEDSFVYNHELEMLMNDAVYSDGYKGYEKAIELHDKDDVAGYYEAVDNLVEAVKTQYMNLCK